MSIYLCPACGATGKTGGKTCKTCNGVGKVPLSIIQGMGNKPKRNIRKTNLDLRGQQHQ